MTESGNFFRETIRQYVQLLERLKLNLLPYALADSNKFI